MDVGLWVAADEKHGIMGINASLIEHALNKMLFKVGSMKLPLWKQRKILKTVTISN